MDWWAILSIGIAILVALFLTGAPIFLAFLIIIISGVVLTFGDAAFGMVVNSMFDTGTTASLGTVPLFVLLGEILFRSGSMEVLLDSIAADAGIEVEDGELRQAYEHAGSELDETAEDLAERLAGSVQEMNLIGDILRTKALAALMRGAVATDRDGNVLDLRFEDPDRTEVVEAEIEQGDQ